MVRLSDDARDCSIFLGFSSGDDFSLAGTGFFVGYPGGADRSLFLVTAAHVAKTLSGGPFAVRMNADNGEARVHDIEEAKWIFHPDKNVDIAVLPFDCPEWAKKTVKSAPTSSFLDSEHEKYFDVGAGDSVQVVGLFHLKPLKQKNLPIVHTGHIALFPSDETFPVGLGDDVIHVSGYLVEISGLEGSSGSPAYVRPTVSFYSDAVSFDSDAVSFDSDANKSHTTTDKTLTVAHCRLYLLGVWIGAWPGKPTEILREEFGLPKDAMVPVGMGLVIPAPKIMEILQLPEIEVMRKQAIQKRDDATALRPLSFPVAPPTSGENPTHQEDFSRLLNVAAKTPKQDG